MFNGILQKSFRPPQLSNRALSAKSSLSHYSSVCNECQCSRSIATSIRQGYWFCCRIPGSANPDVKSVATFSAVPSRDVNSVAALLVVLVRHVSSVALLPVVLAMNVGSVAALLAVLAREVSSVAA